MKKFLIFLASVLVAFSVSFVSSCSRSNKDDNPNGSLEEITDFSESDKGDDRQEGTGDTSDDDSSGDISAPDDDSDPKSDVDLGGRDDNETPRVSFD